MRVAATYGETWVTTGDRTSEGPVGALEGARMVREQMARLDDACAAVGRDPTTLARMINTGPQLDSGLASVEAFRDAVGRYAEVGVTDYVVHWPRATPPFAASERVFEQIFSADARNRS